MSYLENKKSIAGSNTAEIIRKIAYRYIDDNKPCEFYAAPSVKSVFRQQTNGMFDINFDAVYPDAKIGSYAYALMYILSERDMSVTVSARLSRGAEIRINGECIAKTTVDDELTGRKRDIRVNVKKGKNPVFIKAKKTALGFGAEFGEACIAWKPIYMYMPFSEYRGYLGIACSKVFERDIYENTLPDIEGSIPEEFVCAKKEDKSVFEKDGYAYGASSVIAAENMRARLGFSTSGNASVYVNSEKVGGGRGEFCVDADLAAGRNSVVAEIECSRNRRFDFAAAAYADEGQIGFSADEYVRGAPEWLFLGVSTGKNPSVTRYKNIHTEIDADDFWRAGVSENYIRKLRDNDIYGKWTYPIGVVLYGLLAAADGLSDSCIRDYAVGHLEKITQNQSYADFDMRRNGLPSINRPITCLGMLDYCGSCANALLAAIEFAHNRAQVEMIAKRVADYIEKGQERLENGMFYRERADSVIDYKAVWADDLYMSVPFLCRYYKLTGERKYLDDAAEQVLHFKQKLFMPDMGLMSHVYNLIYGKKTGVPWGRGNGWTLVALTELLEVLPEEHVSYSEILSFYKDFCRGILGCFDGMWHQVLNDKASYKETSCTAMFIYGFARGYLRGRLGAEFKDAALGAWAKMCNEAIDEHGNIYGVCCGSAYSFRSDYYKYELPWVKNDTHGTGIVLLAGVEISKL